MIDVAVKEIPDDWEMATFGEVAELLRGVGYKKPDASTEPETGKVPVLRANNIGYGLNFEKLVYVPKHLVKGEQFIKKGDIIIAMSSGSKHLVGKAAQANEDYHGGYGAFCANLRTLDGINAKYVAYFYSSPNNLKRISASSKGSNINNLKREHILNAPIPIAPFEQQKRIVAKIEELFSHIDAGIEALNKAKQLLKQYRQSVLKAAVTGELTKEWREQNKDKLEPASQLLERIQRNRESEYEEAFENWKAEVKCWEINGKVGRKPARPKKNKITELQKINDSEIPENWVFAPLSAAAKIDIGFAFKSKEFEEEGISLLRGDNIEPGSLRWKNRKCWPEAKLPGFEHLFIEEGDVILAMDRPVISSGLKIAIAKKEDLPALLVQRVARIFSEASSCSKYIYYVLSSDDFINHCLGSQTGTQLPHISGAQIEDFCFGLPSAIEQARIVEELEKQFDAIIRLEKEIDIQLGKTEKNKQSILASAFSGDLVGCLGSDGSAKELLDNIRQQQLLHAAKEKLTNKRGSTIKKGEPMAKKKIIDVLKTTETALPPEKLFDLIGADGASADEIESFYIELKETLSDKNVLVETVFDKGVKKGDLISYKVEA